MEKCFIFLKLSIQMANIVLRSAMYKNTRSYASKNASKDASKTRSKHTFTRLVCRLDILIIDILIIVLSSGPQ